jgi:potassium/hydrogen antiporter
MDFSNQAVLVVSLLIVAAILASLIAQRTGVPLLLVFMGIGMLAGEDGPGGISFDNFDAAYLLGTVALAVILLDGGMRTRTESFRIGLRPALSLATFGVILTAGIVGMAAAWALGLSWLEGMLIGAIIGSTDAAAVFSLLHSAGMRLKQRVGTTLEIESGCNDPMAVFLTLVFTAAVATRGANLDEGVLLYFVQQFGLGAVAGVAGGKMLAWLINKVNLTTGLYPLLAAAGGLSVYAATTVAGGSGFLAIYLAGLVLGNSRLNAGTNILRVHDGLAWLSQISLFLMLGLLVTPSALFPMWREGLFIALMLILVARPVAVVLSLLPFHFPAREQAFISWVGLRGAVPIVLATFPMLGGLEDARIYFNVAFFVVLTSLTLQGWTVAPLAKWLKLQLPREHAPYFVESLEVPGQSELKLVGYQVAGSSPALGRLVNQLPLPSGVRVAAAFRHWMQMDSVGALDIRPGDLLYVIARDEDVPLVDRLLVPEDDAEETAQVQYFGSFTLRGDASVGDVADVYGIEVPADARALSLSEYLDRTFYKRCVIGDRVRLGGMELVVREIESGKVSKVGVRVVG